MRKLEAVTRAAAASSGQRPQILESADCDRLLAMLLASAAQTSALYERLDSLIKVLEAKGVLETGAVDAYVPDEATQAARLEWDEVFVARLFRVLAYELDALQHASKEAPAG